MKKFILAATIFVSVFIVFGLFQGSTQEEILVSAPLNPDFVQFMDNMSKGIPYLVSDDGRPLGYVPPPVALSAEYSGKKEASAVAYPTTYDLRTLGKLSPIRNQGGCGACWAFGTYSSLESKLLPGEARDFSEQDLNATHGFDYAECAGGNSSMSHAYLSRWSGPLNETDVPYPYSSTYSPVKHVQQVIWLPARASSTDNDTIKDFIMNHGAVYFAFYWYSTNYNGLTYSYYYPSSHSANHSVAFVGWDDNYSASNFSPAPPGNGAFIARNNWGTGWGNSGYFYISYYDATITEIVSFNNAESTSNYKGNIMYDPLGWTRSWGYTGSTLAWGANIFTASSDDPIKAVGFITNDINTQYTVNVYTGVTAGNPSSGTLAATKSGTNPYRGYYTVVLDSPVAVTTGQLFSVVVKFQNVSALYPLATEDIVNGYSSSATSNTGESFIGPDGTSNWTDLYVLGYQSNCCIKAFTGAPSIPHKIHKHAVGDFDGDGSDEVVMDFGSSGAWMWNGGTWSQLTASNPENMISFDIDGNGDDELAADLGSLGLWMWNGGVWGQLNVNNPEYLIAADTNNNGFEELIIDFGTAGLRWRQEDGFMYGMTGVDPQDIVAIDFDNNGDDEVAADFGTTGMWLWTRVGSTWTLLTTTDPNVMAAVDAYGFGNEGVAAGLGTLGVWLWDSGMWGQLSGVKPDNLVSGKMVLGGGEEIAGDFGSVGLWLWASSVWSQLSGANADEMITADVDGNGIDEIAVDFGTLGLWLWNSGSWTQLTGVNPEGLLAGDIDGDNAKELVVDFGSLGVWIWNAGAWSQISALNPD
jgi:C1A family cysteine protease